LRRHVRLQREAAEKPFAEGMDRLYLEAARRFDCAGEKLARDIERLPVGLAALDFLNGGRKFRIGHGRPAAEPLVKTARHFGCRRLGEGETENALGLRSRKQQAGDACR